MNQEVKDYQRQVIDSLLCKNENKKTLCNELERCISFVLEDIPDAGFDTMEEALGKPSDFAENLMENIPKAERIDAKKRNRQRIILCVVSGVMAVLLTIATLCWLYYSKFYGISVEQTTIIVETQDEFNNLADQYSHIDTWQGDNQK